MIELPLLISLLGFFVAALSFVTTFSRNSRRDTAEEVEERASMNARVLTKLDIIADDIKDIKKDNQDTKKELNKLESRVLVLEQKLNIVGNNVQ